MTSPKERKNNKDNDYRDNIERKRQELITHLSEVERDWLKSICAPLDQLPEEVASAIFVHRFLTRFPCAARRFVAHTQCDEEMERLRKAAGIKSEAEIWTSWLKSTIKQTKGKPECYEDGYIDGMRTIIEFFERIEDLYNWWN